MATISSLGIGSGLDLTSIVDGLVAAEKTPTENRLNTREESITTKLSAFGALKSSLSLFQGSLSSLKIASTFNGKTASVSDESVLSTFASSVADEGTYSVEVTALAKAHSLATSADSAFTSVDETIGSGTLNIQFGTTTTGPYGFTADTSKAMQTISVSEANNNTTLSGLRDYINNHDYGIKAAIVNDGNGYRLTLTSENTGAANSMEITVTDDDTLNNDNDGLSQLAFNSNAQGSMLQTVQAQDAALSINGLNITRETNTVSGAIKGVTLNLLKADVGNTLTVSIGTDTSNAKSALQEFVDGYNGLMTTINSLTSYDTQDNSVGILIGDFSVRSMSNQLRSVLTTTVSQLDSTYHSLAEIGIKTTDKGLLAIDSATLDEALSNASNDVAALFTSQGRSSDEGVSFISASNSTQAGSYLVNVDSMATQGQYNATTLNSLIIDANNDEFTLRVDGTSSGTISLAQATYASGDELAAHIQAQINNDSNLKAAGASVQVVYDSLNNKLDITSLKYGSSSMVDVLTAKAGTASDLGLAVGSGVAGTDISGTINGAAASGSGQVLNSIAGNSAGLNIAVTSGSAGNRGTFTFTRGFAQSLDDLLSSFVETNGIISSREESYNNELDQISTLRDKLDERVGKLESRLIKQFSALDTLISQFNSTSEYLAQQLDNLPQPNSLNRKN
jgi:flagellar hook-associated protein 2